MVTGSICSGGVVPHPSHKVSRVSWYSGSAAACFHFRIRKGLSLSLAGLPRPSAIVNAAMCSPCPGVRALRFGLFPLSLAATNRIDVSFSSLSCQMFFSSGGSRPIPMYSSIGRLRFNSGQVSPFRNLRFIEYFGLAGIGLRAKSAPVPRHLPCALSNNLTTRNHDVLWSSTKKL